MKCTTGYKKVICYHISHTVAEKRDVRGKCETIHFKGRILTNPPSLWK